ncbi:DUF4145 domain-containing protein [Rhizobium leguminosarum]|uniref:DUF4145 domain-containing protein n=1 Tax=Rhizobium leguminosarum TaxID=384 RepID=UPI001C90F37F|nr:DUF4145 domain-containing protein [Rhizobium leguminosarum]MBY2914919.1 DUF4145 domain-containing protein [Rhizobium leguminosarum]MBY2970458.1 DUF4145 domain-containing protein [Rhizobium leguminosarum]MBY2978185.1 DUF4145 domain-containing protein [Rhizobium leguminosarum]MBY2999800.1 DUF4145 domain-containing protein [Rhizobium leguminosarum]MBY3006735.1 DUF4145 domain-containing protein [Rhizobium leguminosarum]
MRFTTESADALLAKIRQEQQAAPPESFVKDLYRRVGGETFFGGAREAVYDARVVWNLNAAQCDHCGDVSIWLHSQMIYPAGSDIPAHEDMPRVVKETFVEAAKIVSASPRASAALARLALQQLCKELDCKKEQLHEQIGELVARGLSPDIQKMLDSVRVIGNNAVHPGEIDMKDDEPTARFILECMNRIVQRLITERVEVDALYNLLPEGARIAIEKRDAKQPQPAPADKETGP